MRFFRPNSQTAKRHVVHFELHVLLSCKGGLEIGRLLGYFSPVFGAMTSEESENPANVPLSVG